MAGLMDYIGVNGGTAGAYVKALDDMTAGLVPAMLRQQQAPAWIDLPGLLGRVDRWTGDKMGLGAPVAALPQIAQQPGLSQSEFDSRFGAMQPPAAQAPAPQMQSPAQAQQAFAMPDSTYAFGGQMVPTFGQAQPMSDEVSARPRGQSPVPVNAPQVQAPSYQSELLSNAPNTAADKYFSFFDRFRPDYAERRDATKAQSETARGMYEVFRSQGMSPNEAAARAVIAARNPEVLKENLARFKNYEERIANQPGNGAAQNYYDFLGNKKAAETAGEKQGSARAEAQIAYPGAAADFQQSMQTISELRNHKGRNQIGWHGPSANLPQDFLRGSEAYGAAKLEERIKSRVFSDQVKTMVGMGALSNAEGSKITDAVASLDRGLKKDEYNRTLDFIQTTMKNGMDKIATKAGQPAPFGWKGNDGWQSVSMPGSNAQVRIKQIQ